MSRRTQLRKKRTIQARQRTLVPSDETWDVVFWMPTKSSAPAREWLMTVPGPVRSMMVAIVDAVRDGPPPAFPPGQYWHAMRGEMRGIYEARDRHGSTLYRLFCLLDRDAPHHGLSRPALVVLLGGEKDNATEMEDSVYQAVRAAMEDYMTSSPRRYLPPPGVPGSVR